MDEDLVHAFENWIISIEFFNEYLEKFLFINPKLSDAVKTEMTYEEIVVYLCAAEGWKRGTPADKSIYGELRDTTSPYKLRNFLLKCIDFERKYPSQLIDGYFFNMFKHCGVRFISELLKVDISATNLKVKLIVWKNEIDNLKELCKKTYISNDSSVSKFFEIYSLVTDETGINTIVENKGMKKLTEPQKALLIFYILNELKIGIEAVKHYTLMADLTNNSITNTKQYFDSGFKNLFQTKTGNYRIEDLILVRDYFKSMGLNKLSENVQNELNRIKDPKK